MGTRGRVKRIDAILASLQQWEELLIFLWHWALTAVIGTSVYSKCKISKVLGSQNGPCLHIS